MFAWNPCYGSLSTLEQNDIIALFFFFFVKSEHNSHHLLTLNRKIFIGGASSDYDTISIY